MKKLIVYDYFWYIKIQLNCKAQSLISSLHMYSTETCFEGEFLFIERLVPMLLNPMF